MDKDYKKYFNKYKYRPLNYSEWTEYVLNEYQNLRSKNLEKRIKEQRKQVKKTPINFNW